MIEGVDLRGWGWADLVDEHGTVVVRSWFDNKITELGDRMYGELGAGITGGPTAPTGMQLGTGSTAASKNGAGAAIGTYIVGSAIGFVSTWPQSTLVSGSRVIQYKCSWAPGVATNSTINEVVLINQSTGTNSAAPAANTVARALFVDRPMNKTSGLSLVVVWQHVLLGA